MESLELFEKLKVALGEDVALELVQRYTAKQDLSEFATKEDIKTVRDELRVVRNELKDDLKNFRSDVDRSFNSIERSIRIATWLIGILITLAVVIIKYAP
jgi:hypothetical protein